MSYLIIQWPHGDRRILDHVMSEYESADWEGMEKYRTIFGDNIEWVGCDQKRWLREQGFLP